MFHIDNWSDCFHRYSSAYISFILVSPYSTILEGGRGSLFTADQIGQSVVGLGTEPRLDS
jgi:hypothetical protein